jgi:hypothetical protein
MGDGQLAWTQATMRVLIDFNLNKLLTHGLVRSISISMHGNGKSGLEALVSNVVRGTPDYEFHAQAATLPFVGGKLNAVIANICQAMILAVSPSPNWLFSKAA